MMTETFDTNYGVPFGSKVNFSVTPKIIIVRHLDYFRSHLLPTSVTEATSLEGFIAYSPPNQTQCKWFLPGLLFLIFQTCRSSQDRPSPLIIGRRR